MPISPVLNYAITLFLALPRYVGSPVHGSAAHSKGALRDDSSSLHPGRQGSGAEVGRVQVQKIDLDNMLLGIHLIQVIHHSNDSFGTFYLKASYLLLVSYC